jgi:glycosyltransferase involved in cell wall biosynthesis
VFAETPCDRYRAGRSFRALRAAGFHVLDFVRPAKEAATLPPAGVWFVRAGAWPVVRPLPLRGLPRVVLPPSSATGRPLCALGAVRRSLRSLDGGGKADELSPGWSELLSATGGELDREPFAAGAAEIWSAYLEAPLAAGALDELRAGASLRTALASVLREQPARVVRHAALDVVWDARLRVVQILPSAQQGGAERIALDLAAVLPREHVESVACVLWSPPRKAFELPRGSLDLSTWPGGHETRFAALAAALTAWGADLTHVHLLARHDLLRLGALGFTPMVTVHNVRAGWPEGFASLRVDEAALLVGCSLRASADAASISGGPVVRTVYNGIDRAAFRPAPEARDGARRRLGLGRDDLVLLAVGNPRPQKRLEHLPAVVAALKARTTQNVTVLVAGAPSQAVPASLDADAALRRAIVRFGLERVVHLLGSVDDVRRLHHAADVFVSVSAHEGLSLAQLEALAAGLPVVATAVGGTPELAALSSGVTLLPLEAPPDVVARAVLNVARPNGTPPPLAEMFDRTSMARAYARLYPRAVERTFTARSGEGLWLVTNNFATGGAQASARRLLAALRSAGIRVRAATLEEQRDYPTPGRRALMEAGIPVLALPPPGTSDAVRSIDELLAALDADRPAAVVLWNALAAHKVLLADALLDVPLFDVSPGEMYFASLERHFASTRAAPPYAGPADYGARLRGVVVKYAAEAARARDVLGARVHVIPNGIEVPGKARPRHSRSGFVMGTCVRLHPHKRLEDLIDALRLAAPRLPPHVLKIAGGPDRGCEAYAAELRARARGLSVEWQGEIADVDRFSSELDIFALVAEPAGCPNASLEAMAQGLPVAATDVGGMSEQVVAGETGWLTPARDVPAFAEVLCEAAHDAERRERFGEAGRRRIASHFGVERMAGEYRRVLFDGA